MQIDVLLLVTFQCVGNIVPPLTVIWVNLVMRFVLLVKEEAVGVPEIVPTPLALEVVKLLVAYTVVVLLGLVVLVVVVDKEKRTEGIIPRFNQKVI